MTLQQGNQVFHSGSWRPLTSLASKVAVSADTLSAPTAFVVESALQALGAVVFSLQHKLDFLILPLARATASVTQLLLEKGFAILALADGSMTMPKLAGEFQPGRISLLTSGTTGLPKIISHSWKSLNTVPENSAVVKRKWLLPYQVGTYAWFQIVCQALFQPCQHLVPCETLDFEEMFKLASTTKVNAISATPTFWKMAALSVPEVLLRSVELDFITLGGEIVDQAILDQLASIYPQAKITHIYASTEAGACIVVKDGMAGFPVELLDPSEPGKPQLRVVNSQLQVLSPFACQISSGNPDRWIDTGDLVEVRGERAYFVGRSNLALINVGGNKAYPADIEAVLLSHPAIAWCRVRGTRSPLVGYLPEADLVLKKSDTAKSVSEAELTQFCEGKLPEYAIPRFWNFLDAIPASDSLKSQIL